MRRHAFASAIAFLIGGCASPTPEKPELVIVSDATFPPFHYLDDAGEATGFDIELARLVAERAGYRPAVEVLPYSRLFSGLEEQRHDVVAATTGITPERQKAYLFSTPIFETCQVALVRVGEGEPGSLKDLVGLRVGASGSGTAALAMRSLAGAEPVSLESEGETPLLEEAVDAIVVDEFDAVAMARTSQGRLRVLGEPVARETYAFVLSKERTDLKEQLDRALAVLREEGVIDALRERFGVKRDPDWPVRLR